MKVADNNRKNVMRTFRLLYFVNVILLILSKPIRFQVASANIRLFDISILLLVVLLIYDFLVGENKFIVPPLRFILPLILIFLYSALLIPFQAYLARTVVELIEVVELILVFFVAWNSPSMGLNELDFKRIIDLVFYLSLIGAVVGIAYYLTIGGRFVGKWFIFGYFSYGLYYSYFNYLSKKKERYIIYFLVFTLAILFSRTRGLWIASILALFIIHVFQYKAVFQGKMNFRPIILGMLVVALVGLTSPDIQHRFSSLFTGSSHLFARPVLWLAGIHMFIDHPFGVGLGNFDYYLVYNIAWLFEKGVYSKIIPEDVIGITIKRMLMTTPGPHSDWIKFLSETGLVGVLLYGFFWMAALKDALSRRVHDSETLILATFLTYIFLSSFLGLWILKGGFILVIFLHIFLSLSRDRRA